MDKLKLDWKQNLKTFHYSCCAQSETHVLIFKFRKLFFSRASTEQFLVCGIDYQMVQVNFCQKLFFLQNMGCTKIVLNVRNNICTQQVLPRFELGIFMY